MAKGKKQGQRKQWRKIDTQEVDDFLEKSTREERQGLVVEGIPDAELFFVDKAPGDADKAQKPAIPRKLYHRQRLTRAQAIIQGAHVAQPLSSVPMKKKGSKPAAKPTKGSKAAPSTVATKKASSSKTATLKSKSLALAPASGDLWEAATAKRNKDIVPATKRMRTVAAAVAVDAPGCSYNPDKDMHQDAVAEAVAAEMKKIYDRDLQPTAPLRVVDYDPEEDELAMLQVDGEESEEESENEESDKDEEYGASGRGRGRKEQERKKTQKDRNRERRKKENEGELDVKRKEKIQRKQLANLHEVSREVNETLAEREAKRLRREADLADKAASQPPKLGKHKFVPLPVQVLTTEEITESKGSLRQLKPTAMLAQDRFKSLQRRGLIEPRRKITKKSGKKVEYVHGQRADNAAERQAEVAELRATVRKAKETAPTSASGSGRRKKT